MHTYSKKNKYATENRYIKNICRKYFTKCENKYIKNDNI